MSMAIFGARNSAPYWNTGREPHSERTAPVLSGLVAGARQSNPPTPEKHMSIMTPAEFKKFKNGMNEVSEQIKASQVQRQTHGGNPDSESDVRRVLVLSFFEFLGYDPKSRDDVRTAVSVQTGSRPDEADAVLYRDGRPYIVIECKRDSLDEHKDWKQLNGYFCVLGGTKFAVLTNGIQYLFYGETGEQGEKGIEKKPFLDFDITKLKDSDIEALQYFRKTVEPKDTSDAVVKLRYKAAIMRNIRDELSSPSQEFVSVLTKGVVSGKKNRMSKELLQELTEKTVRQVTEERVAAKIEANESDTASELHDVLLSRAFQGAIQGMLLGECKSSQLALRDISGGYAIYFDDKKGKTVIYLLKGRGGKFEFGIGRIQAHATWYPYESVNSLAPHRQTIKEIVEFHMGIRSNPPEAWDTPSKETNKEE